MEFVSFSPWYIVMIALVVGIVACLMVFFMMDKKDKKIIKTFLEESQNSEPDVSEISKDDGTKTE